MRTLAPLALLLCLSSSALASPVAKHAPAESPATPAEYIDLAMLEAENAQAWRDYLTERRSVQLQRLKAYADDGVFPVNQEVPGLANLFMDEQGRRCAMAHLIWEDGQQNLVKVYASIDNDVLLGEVTDGPLLDWILTSGLTQEEAAFIQEPDFEVSASLELPVQEMLIAQEQARLRQHFSAAAKQVEVYGARSLDAAMEALGDRVLTPPPSSTTQAPDAA